MHFKLVIPLLALLCSVDDSFACIVFINTFLL
jgi:hypothetical protein